ncbi:MAG: hypothetical protein PUE27_00055 [Sharpea porci]|uniref:O-antigen ligase family protein n=1 Tax=Sharpea porci TaxID=2652286 RepID=UPI002409D7F1|nr:MULTISPECIES: O-antigen ligase family protein [Coprobacillaceae]MDD6594886.1 hypothetical protein [Catenibacterium mitsuokai]MDD6710472.1 hypothetical protein [Sharpea porci]
MRKPIEKRYLVFLILFYLLVFQTPLSSILPFFGYTDEIIALSAISLFFIELKKRNFVIYLSKYGYAWLIFVFLVAGILGNTIYKFQPILSVAIPSLFLSIKFWLAVYTGTVLFRNLNIQKDAGHIYLHIRFTIMLFSVLFVVDNIVHIFPANVRYGLRSTQLFYGVPTGFAAVCAFIFALLTIIRPYVKRTGKWYLILALLMTSTLRSKAFAAVFAFGLIYYFTYIREKKITIKTLILFVPLVFLMVQDQIEYYFFSNIQSDSARYQLLTTSFKIMKDYFPIGTGFGTFGSYMSAKNYSPLYQMYGISNVNGLIKGAAYFVSDSFWPMIAGETGIVGLIAIIAVLCLMVVKIQKIKQWNKAMYAGGLMAMAYLLIVSMAESSFVNPVAIPLALVLGLIYGQDEKNQGI